MLDAAQAAGTLLVRSLRMVQAFHDCYAPRQDGMQWVERMLSPLSLPEGQSPLTLPTEDGYTPYHLVRDTLYQIGVVGAVGDEVNIVTSLWQQHFRIADDGPHVIDDRDGEVMPFRWLELTRMGRRHLSRNRLRTTRSVKKIEQQQMYVRTTSNFRTAEAWTTYLSLLADSADRDHYDMRAARRVAHTLRA